MIKELVVLWKWRENGEEIRRMINSALTSSYHTRKSKFTINAMMCNEGHLSSVEKKMGNYEYNYNAVRNSGFGKTVPRGMMCSNIVTLGNNVKRTVAKG